MTWVGEKGTGPPKESKMSLIWRNGTGEKGLGWVCEKKELV